MIGIRMALGGPLETVPAGAAAVTPPAPLGAATGGPPGALAGAPARLPAPPLDEAAFTVLYRRLAGPLRGYLRRLAGDAATADDLLQEAFYRLLRADLPELDERQVTTWLYRTATRLAHDGWRQAARRRRHELAAAPPAAGTPARDGAAATDVERALAQLRPRERALLWLAHVEGAPHRDIAQVLGVGEASVKVLLHRARKRLARALEKRGFAPEDPR